MSWMSDAFCALLLTSVTGSIAYLAWELIKVWMDRQKKLRFIYPILIGVLPFFLVPVVYLYLKVQTGILTGMTTGTLFMRTPAIHTIQSTVGAIWLTGFSLSLCVYLFRFLILYFKLYRKNLTAEESIVRVKERIIKELGIKENVAVYQNYAAPAPMVTGLFKKCIILPVQVYDERELEAVMYHELVHIRQHIVELKYIGIFIRMLHWMNPCVYLLLRELDEWGETACDLEVHYNTYCNLSFQEYFRIVLDGVDCGETSEMKLVTQFRKMKGIKGRIMRVRGYKRKKDLQAVSGLLMAAVFCFGCTTTAMAAGNGFAEAYEGIYSETEVEIEEDGLGNTLIEYTEEATDSSAKNVIEIETNSLSRTVKGLDVTVSANTIAKTASFSANKDGTITVTVSVTPSNKSVRVGIIEPDGTKRYVTSSGTISHTFSLTATGSYRVFVENTNSVSVSVEGSYLY